MLLDLSLLSQAISISLSRPFGCLPSSSQGSSMSNPKGSKPLCCPRVDGFSQLPDGIIDNILIRLPIADAARTAVLSRKWKDAWINISKLKFDHEFAFDHPKLITIIYGILMLHLGPIIGFKLLIILPDKSSDIDRVFHFLSRKGVQELDVCILQRGKKSYYEISPGYVLPSHIYSCLQLRCLDLAQCTIKPPCNFGGFRNLNSLRLQYLQLTNSVFENFIFKCPLLEELIIEHCNFIESSVTKINASNLKRFCFNGIGACFCFTSAPLLTRLTYLDSRTDENDKRCFDFEGAEKSSLEKFCNALPALEHLEVDYYFLQSLEVRDMSGKCGRHPKWLHRLETLEAYYVRLWNMDEVTSLLGLIGCSPNLKELVIEMDPPNNADGMENPFSSLEANHLDFSSCKKLQVVSLQGIVDRDWGMELVKLLLLKSPNLKTMYVETLEHATPGKRLEILTKVTRFRRASAEAEIDFC